MNEDCDMLAAAAIQRQAWREQQRRDRGAVPVASRYFISRADASDISEEMARKLIQRAAAEAGDE